jgi:hypothetical protein
MVARLQSARLQSAQLVVVRLSAQLVVVRLQSAAGTCGWLQSASKTCGWLQSASKTCGWLQSATKTCGLYGCSATVSYQALIVVTDSLDLLSILVLFQEYNQTFAGPQDSWVCYLFYLSSKFVGYCYSFNTHSMLTSRFMVITHLILAELTFYLL